MKRSMFSVVSVCSLVLLPNVVVAADPPTGGDDKRSGRVVRSVDSKSGRSVESLSEFPTEKEKLFRPGTTFETVAATERDGVLHVRQREVASLKPAGEETVRRPVVLTTGTRIANYSSDTVTLDKKDTMRAEKFGHVDIGARDEYLDAGGRVILSDRVDPSVPSVPDMLKGGTIGRSSYTTSEGGTHSLAAVSRNTYWPSVITKGGGKEEGDALRAYTGPAYTEMNDLLRGTASGRADTRSEVVRDVVGATSALNKMPPSGGTVYRGERDRPYSGYSVGGKSQDASFTSTSVDPKVASGFAGAPLSAADFASQFAKPSGRSSDFGRRSDFSDAYSGRGFSDRFSGGSSGYGGGYSSYSGSKSGQDGDSCVVM